LERWSLGSDARIRDLRVGELGITTQNTAPSGLPFADHVAERSIPEPLPDDDDHVDRRPGASKRTERLANQALGSVSLGCVPYPSRRGDSEPRPLRRPRPIEHEHKPWRHDTPPPLLNAQELRALSNSIAGRIPT
jgi:hypothetical protein